MILVILKSGGQGATVGNQQAVDGQADLIVLRILKAKITTPASERTDASIKTVPAAEDSPAAAAGQISAIAIRPTLESQN